MKALHKFRFLFLVLVAALVGCGEKEAPKAPIAQKPVVQKPFVVAIPTYPGFAIPYLAQEKGFFGDQKVELKRIDDAAVINSGMVRGDIDACFTSVDSFVLAASQQVDAVAVLLTDESRGADGIVAKPRIKSVSELKGKKVAANLGWPGHFFLLYNLKKAGIPFKDVPITNMDADKAGAAFVSGALDAAVTWEPWLSKATSGNAGKILVSTSTLPGVIVDVMLVRKGTAQERPAAVQAFVNGYYRALAAYEADKGSGTQVMAKAVGIEPKEFDAMTQGFRFIKPEEAQKLLAAQGAVEQLFKTAADIWLEAQVIDKLVSNEGRSVDKFVNAYPGK